MGAGDLAADGAGSSPRVRGTRCLRTMRCAPWRFIPACAGNTRGHPAFVTPRHTFIPACAGNTPTVFFNRRRKPVHPRVCGEHQCSAWSASCACGSSPRVRGTPRTPPPRQSRRTVHPRVCGEHSLDRPDVLNQSGSSPRVRGTRRWRGAGPLRGRFIPACAGNTYRRRTVARIPAVHPRVCGEHSSLEERAFTATGSSPRVRGTPYNTAAVKHDRTVHPRVCGEHRGGAVERAPVDGSSPRVRGTQLRSRPRRVSVRFIPACAGNTRSPDTLPSGQSVHPRVCGEHLDGLDTQALAARFIPACAGNTSTSPRCRKLDNGSSPRVRGTPVRDFDALSAARFIPACAGNTRPCGICRPSTAVHPRVCGEHGTPQRGRRGVRGFIPACAGNTAHPRRSTRLGTVHPRVCGEHYYGAKDGRPVAGSSPRVRGTRQGTYYCPIVESVHPRVCGEHFHGRRRRGLGAGSSPRVRGTLDFCGRFVVQRRFIPACAGNTCTSRHTFTPKPVHPRVCGEHAAALWPRCRERRFIPACAGNTPQCGQGMWVSPVHPRVCGEHCFVAIASNKLARFIPACAGNTPPSPARPQPPRGSSPRVRGTPESALRPPVPPPVHPRVCGEHLMLARGDSITDRFIPACAGNTVCIFANGAASPVHPRVCGEHRTRGFRSGPMCGSSPRVRGTRHRDRRDHDFDRFIPACAGNTSHGDVQARHPTVHPRVCGEHPRLYVRRPAHDGSSPRVRGTRVLRREQGFLRRFIPACAGNTPRRA